MSDPCADVYAQLIVALAERDALRDAVREFVAHCDHVAPVLKSKGRREPACVNKLRELVK